MVPVALFLLSLAACKSQDSEELSELQVSLTSVVFNKDGGNETLTVSGVKEWSYISNVGESGWLVPTKEGDKLTLTATSNPSGQERKAELIISSRVGVQKVYVVQSASDLVLSFSENELLFPYKAGEKVVQVTTNSDSWTFAPLSEEDKEWITIIGADGAKTVIIRVSENKTYEDRTATLIAKAQNDEQVGLLITQQGVAKYLLPFQDKAKTYNDLDIINFEQSRGSILQAYQPASWNSSERKEIDGIAQFITTSDYMPMIVYQRQLDELKYTSASLLLYIEDDAVQEELKEYEAFLAENSYEFIENESTRINKIYKNKEVSMAANIQVKQGGAIVTFIPFYPQTEVYPTFTEMPVAREGWMDMLLNPEYKVQEVFDAEKAAGSVVTFTNIDNGTGYTKSAGFEYAKSTDPMAPINATYWFNLKVPNNADDSYIQTVVEMCIYFSEPTFGIRTAGRRVYVTEEFEQLVIDNGYIYEGTSKDGQTFYYYKPINERFERYLYVKKVHYTDINRGDPALMVGYYGIFLSPLASQERAERESRLMQSAKEGDFDAFLQLRTNSHIERHELSERAGGR